MSDVQYRGEARIYCLGVIAPNHGERGSASLYWGMGAMLQWSRGRRIGAKPLEAERNLKTK